MSDTEDELREKLRAANKRAGEYRRELQQLRESMRFDPRAAEQGLVELLRRDVTHTIERCCREWHSTNIKPKELGLKLTAWLRDRWRKSDASQAPE